jgi:hypothetical protein
LRKILANNIIYIESKEAIKLIKTEMENSANKDIKAEKYADAAKKCIVCMN